jgi:hypothetical protein
MIFDRVPRSLPGTKTLAAYDQHPLASRSRRWSQGDHQSSGKPFLYTLTRSAWLGRAPLGPAGGLRLARHESVLALQQEKPGHSAANQLHTRSPRSSAQTANTSEIVQNRFSTSCVSSSTTIARTSISPACLSPFQRGSTSQELFAVWHYWRPNIGQAYALTEHHG